MNLQLDGSQFDWLEHGDPYNLSPERRAILVYKYWQRSVDVAWQRLASIKAQYDTILQDTEEISKRRKLAILRKAKIIGITTTVRRLDQLTQHRVDVIFITTLNTICFGNRLNLVRHVWLGLCREQQCIKLC
jgi:hypothetical protein